MFSFLFKSTLAILISSTILSAEGMDLKDKGIAIKYLDLEENQKSTVIKRIHDDECKNVKVNPTTIWAGNYANEKVPEKCKKTFATTIGKLSPMKIDDGIETYGELEVIDFIQKAQNDDTMQLIDARTLVWFELSTIPGAKNIPFTYFNPKKYPDEFEDVLEDIGVVLKDGKYNFTNAKTLTIFCNGAWCLQSSLAIKNLLNIGYPKEKLFWYRGGMYNWTLAGLTTIVP